MLRGFEACNSVGYKIAIMGCDASSECFWYGGVALAGPNRVTQMRMLNCVGSWRRFCHSSSAYKIYVNRLCKQCVIFALLSVHRRGISSSPDISLDRTRNAKRNTFRSSIACFSYRHPMSWDVRTILEGKQLKVFKTTILLSIDASSHQKEFTKLLKSNLWFLT